jgi:hypothetical protein
MSTNDTPMRIGGPPRHTDLVRSGPVLSGVVVGMGLFALVDVLWLALAHDADSRWAGDALRWLSSGTAAVALLLTGFTAGLFAGVRGMGAGLAHGLTAWGLLLLLSVTAVVPGALDLTVMLAAGFEEDVTTTAGVLRAAVDGATSDSALWASFWTLVVGLMLAASGGVLGGALRRPTAAPAEQALAASSATPASQGPLTAVDSSTAPVPRNDVAGMPRLRVHHMPPSREDVRFR